MPLTGVSFVVVVVFSLCGAGACTLKMFGFPLPGVVPPTTLQEQRRASTVHQVKHASPLNTTTTTHLPPWVASSSFPENHMRKLFFSFNLIFQLFAPSGPNLMTSVTRENLQISRLRTTEGGWVEVNVKQVSRMKRVVEEKQECLSLVGFADSCSRFRRRCWDVTYRFNLGQPDGAKVQGVSYGHCVRPIVKRWALKSLAMEECRAPSSGWTWGMCMNTCALRQSEVCGTLCPAAV